MKTTEKYLIGGKRMIELGSDRTTEDTDYLINEKGTELFTHEDEIDYINCNSHGFFNKIWNVVSRDGEVSPQMMLELKGYSLTQHYLNRNFNKVITTEYDMKRLVIDFDLKGFEILGNYITNGQLKELNSLINNN